MKTTIVNIARFTTKKDGTPLISQKGKPYTSVRIQVPEYGEQWLSGFENADNKDWHKESEVEIEVEKRGDFLNFSTPKREEAGSGELKLAISVVSAKLDRVIELLKNGPERPYPTPESEGINLDESPF